MVRNVTAAAVAVLMLAYVGALGVYSAQQTVSALRWIAAVLVNR